MRGGITKDVRNRKPLVGLKRYHIQHPCQKPNTEQIKYFFGKQIQVTDFNVAMNIQKKKSIKKSVYLLG